MPESKETDAHSLIFGEVAWLREDLEESPRKNGLGPTQERIDELLESYCLRDESATAMVATGWTVIHNAIADSKDKEKHPEPYGDLLSGH